MRRSFDEIARDARATVEAARKSGLLQQVAERLEAEPLLQDLEAHKHKTGRRKGPPSSLPAPPELPPTTTAHLSAEDESAVFRARMAGWKAGELKEPYKYGQAAHHRLESREGAEETPEFHRRNAEALRKFEARKEEQVKAAPASMEARDFKAVQRMNSPSLTLEEMLPGFNRVPMRGKFAVVQLLEMAEAFGGYGEPGFSLEGTRLMAELGNNWAPVTDDEIADLEMLVRFAPPKTELYWRWATALKHHVDRVVKERLQKLSELDPHEMAGMIW